MKKKFLPTIVLITGCMLMSISVSMVYSQTVQSYPVSLKIVNYTCPNHPELVQDHPGNCPKCGTKLVDNMDMSKTNVNQYNDSTMLKHPQGNMNQDTLTMKKVPMVNDSIVKNNPVTLK